jgi:hypothetical protein
MISIPEAIGLFFGLCWLLISTTVTAMIIIKMLLEWVENNYVHKSETHKNP